MSVAKTLLTVTKKADIQHARELFARSKAHAAEDVRLAQLELKQQSLNAKAKPANFNTGTYNESDVVGLTFEQQRIGKLDSGSDFVNRLPDGSKTPGYSEPTRAMDLSEDPVSYSLLGRRTEDLGDAYRNQQFGISQKELRLSPHRAVEDPIVEQPKHPLLRMGMQNEYSDVSLLSSSRDFGAEYAEQQTRIGSRIRHSKFRSRTASNIAEAEETGSVVGLLRRQNELYDQGGMVPSAGSLERAEYDLLGNQIKKMENRAYGDVLPADQHGPYNSIGNDAVRKRLYSGDAYDEAAHMRSNNLTSTNAMNGGTRGPTPPSSSNTPVNPTTTPTGSTDYSGFYQPSQGNTQSSVGVFNMMEADGMAGVAGSIGFGALIGGTANYAMGGEFGEGAMMGGLAGGAMKIGARAIQANEVGIENYLQRTALGENMGSMSREQAGEAIRRMQQAPDGLMPGMAFNVLKSGAPSVGMQSRYAVMGGSMLSGVAFTGRRNDKRRGFNSHRGNRI